MIRYNSSQLKHLALKALNGKMGIFLTAYLVYFLINTIASSLLTNFTGVNNLIDYETGQLAPNFSPTTLAIYLISSYILSLILSVFDLGFNKMFLHGSRQENFTWEMVFYGFKHEPDRIIILQLLLGVISFGCVIPGYILVVLSGVLKIHWGFAIAGLVVILLGLIPSYYFTIVFSQSMFLIAEHEDMRPIAALKESHRLMKTNKMRYFILALSFLPLHFACYLTCNIGTFLLYPFLGMTNAFFYRNIIGEIGEHESVMYY